VGSYIRANSFRNVDLPVPDLPMIPTCHYIPPPRHPCQYYATLTMAGFGCQQRRWRAARGWAHPPYRHFKIQSCCCLGSAFEVAASHDLPGPKPVQLAALLGAPRHGASVLWHAPSFRKAAPLSLSRQNTTRLLCTHRGADAVSAVNLRSARRV
jgi:hypothetical protein